MTVHDGTTQIRLERGSTERFVTLRKELGVTSFGINQLNLQPGQRGRIHRHERQEEVYLVLEGELTVSVEGVEDVLGPDELLRVAPGLRRQLINRSSAPVTLLALGGYGDHESRDGEAFTDWDQETGALPQEVPLPEDLPPGP
jgi:uncharacterized cupin superfamily protein